MAGEVERELAQISIYLAKPETSFEEGRHHALEPQPLEGGHDLMPLHRGLARYRSGRSSPLADA